jgi:hypothetical protein
VKKIGLEQFFEGGYKLGALWMQSGIWFQSAGAEKLNRVRVLGTTRESVPADRRCL